MKIHVLYEHEGEPPRPTNCAYSCLLRPLTHPGIAERIECTFGTEYRGQKVDGVIVQRTWNRLKVSSVLVKKLAEDTHRAGARLIYALDDNHLDDPPNPPYSTQGRPEVTESFIRRADAVLVTTEALRNRYADLNPHIAVVPHALDERLLVERTPPASDPSRPLVIGYMGTRTHDDDLQMVLPALEAIQHRHRVEFQIIGVIGHLKTRRALRKLRVRELSPKPHASPEYPSFLSWFSRCVRWDIAIAPLRDHAFNRCKSDIKFLDYSAIGAAGIYSRSMPYETTVRHMETGWLADYDTEAWVEALSRLIENPILRVRLARNAYQYLMKERILERHVDAWIDALDVSIRVPNSFTVFGNGR